MRRKRLPPNDPVEWLQRAQSNLIRAKSPSPDAYLEDYCFDAQQAAEKAIKAVFVAYGRPFPYVHDLGRLITLLRNTGLRIPKYVVNSDRLTRFAVESRYPGLSGPVTTAVHRRSIRIAEAVVRWAARIVGKRIASSKHQTPHRAARRVGRAKR
jgi:HEPN domain-containing protein